MESLTGLNKKYLTLLEENNLLVPLVRNEYIKSLVKTINLENETIENIKKKFLEENKIDNDADYQDWLNKNQSIRKVIKHFSYSMYQNKKVL